MTTLDPGEPRPDRRFSERRQLDRALRECEERYQALFAHLDCVYLLDFEGRFLDANPAALELLGYQREDIPDLNVSSLLDDDQVVRAFEVMAELRESGSQTRPTEFRLRRKTGEYADVETKASVILRDGQPYAVLGIGHDITEKKQAEETLRKSEEKYRTVADFTYDWEAWRSPDGTYRYVSPACERITGHTVAEFMADPDLVVQITHPDDRLKVIEHYRAVDHEAREQDLEFDHRILTPGGETRWISHSCTPVYDERGQWLGRRASNRDITHRKKAEEQLRESEDRLLEAQHLGKIGNWEWIPADDKVIWSAEMYAIFGVAPEAVNLTTEMSMQAFHPEDRAMVVEATRKTLEERTSQPIECRILKPDGTISYVYGRGEAVLDAEGQLVKMTGIYQDITERKEAEEALRQTEHDPAMLRARG